MLTANPLPPTLCQREWKGSELLRLAKLAEQRDLKPVCNGCGKILTVGKCLDEYCERDLTRRGAPGMVRTILVPLQHLRRIWP